MSANKYCREISLDICSWLRSVRGYETTHTYGAAKWFLGYKNDSYGFDLYLQQNVFVDKNIFDESKLFSNATLIWAIKCKVGDFAQELVGTRSLSLSKASSPPHSLHHSNPTICNTRWYEVEIDHISGLICDCIAWLIEKAPGEGGKDAWKKV